MKTGLHTSPRPRRTVSLVALLVAGPSLLASCGGSGQIRTGPPVVDRDMRGRGASTCPPRRADRTRVVKAGRAPVRRVRKPRVRRASPRGRVRKRSRRSTSGPLYARWRHGAESGPKLDRILDRAEKLADVVGRRVLVTGRRLVLRAPEVIRGSCWTFADAVFRRAGYHGRRRHTVFKGGRTRGYARRGDLRPGDWMHFINLSFRRNGHSGIFVAWLDRDRREALVMSYRGGGLREPGNYRSYKLSKVYRIIRGKPLGRVAFRSGRR